MLQHSERFAGIVKNDFASCVIPGKRAGGFGISLVRVAVDDIKYTALEDPYKPLNHLNRPMVSNRIFSPSSQVNVAVASFLENMKPREMRVPGKPTKRF